MPYRLRDHLYWCDCGGTLVFLDVEADLYFCLPPPIGDSFKALAGGQAGQQDSERLAPLIARGLLVEDDATPGLCPATKFEPVTGDLLQGQVPPLEPILFVGAFFAELRAAWALRRTPFHLILKRVEAAAAGLASRPAAADNGLAALVSASMAVSLVLRATDRCLVRALACHSICTRHGFRAQLMFGVRLNPFAAHCWVQRSGRVLVGDYEQVRLFQPIAAFG